MQTTFGGDAPSEQGFINLGSTLFVRQSISFHIGSQLQGMDIGYVHAELSGLEPLSMRFEGKSRGIWVPKRQVRFP